jgi:hypothetical protein
MNLEQLQQKQDSKLEATNLVKYQNAIKAFVDTEIAAGASFEDIQKYCDWKVARVRRLKPTEEGFDGETKSEGIEKEEFEKASKRILDIYSQMDWRLVTESYFQDALDQAGAYEEKTEAA